MVIGAGVLGGPRDSPSEVPGGGPNHAIAKLLLHLKGKFSVGNPQASYTLGTSLRSNSTSTTAPMT